MTPNTAARDQSRGSESVNAARRLLPCKTHWRATGRDELRQRSVLRSSLWHTAEELRPSIEGLTTTRLAQDFL